MYEMGAKKSKTSGGRACYRALHKLSNNRTYCHGCVVGRAHYGLVARGAAGCADGPGAKSEGLRGHPCDPHDDLQRAPNQTEKVAVDQGIVIH